MQFILQCLRNFFYVINFKHYHSCIVTVASFFPVSFPSPLQIVMNLRSLHPTRSSWTRTRTGISSRWRSPLWSALRRAQGTRTSSHLCPENKSRRNERSGRDAVRR